MKIKGLIIGLVFGLGLTSAALQADDTEIYTNPGVTTTDAPLVMFSLDFRSNLTNTYGGCSKIGSGTDADPYCPEVKYYVDQGIDLVAEGVATGDNPFYFFDAFRLALKVVLQQVNGVKIGLMMNHEHENSCEGPTHGAAANNQGKNRCSNGGVMLMGFQLLEKDDDTTRDNFNNKLKALKRQKTAAFCGKNTDSACPDHTYQGEELFFEFYRYLIGGGVYNGHNGWTDFESGNTVDTSTDMRCTDADNITNLACWDTAIETGSGNNFDYISPLDNIGSCAKLFTVNLFFGNSQQAADSDNAIGQSIANEGMNLSSPTFEEVVAFLQGNDLGDSDFGVPDIDGNQNVTSYFYYDGNIQNQVNALAQAGGTSEGRVVSQNPADLVLELTETFNEILSVSTTFVSANLPVNSFNRAELLDHVFYALFQLDPDNKPDWRGNVKRLRKKDTTDPTTGEVTSLLVDVNDVNAIATDNRFRFDALTFWTDPNGADVQAFDADEGEIQGKDGRSVNRGGAGQQIPGFLSGNPGDDNADSGARKMFTEPASYTNGTPTPLLPFNADGSDTTTAAALAADLSTPDDSGTISTAEALERMRWLRGQDSADADGDSDTTEARPWLMGDILHSRPQIINYGALGSYSATNQDIRILTGTNHGVMHMFRNSDTSGNPDGSEVWAFLPRETLDNARTLRLNAVGAPHPYGVDGPPSILIKDIGNDGTIDDAAGDKAFAYFGLRRGGKSYYSLDLSDPDNLPPEILWSVNSDAGSDTEELGLTFSPVRLGNVDFGSGAVPAVFVAGGYDINKDTRPGPGTDDAEGNAIYILNAETGALIWKAVFDSSPAAPTTTRFEHAELKDSIPMEIGLLDGNGDGVIEQFYVADTGGRLWRGDTPPPAANPSVSDIREKWALTLFANLGRHVTNDNPNDRRFFHGVDIAQVPGDQATWHIALGSGDRANPKETVDDNKLFLIKDPYGFNASTASGQPGEVNAPANTLPFELTDLGDITDNCIQEDTCSGSPPNLTHGWFLTLSGSGEKVLSSPLIANDAIFFSTFLPNAGPNPGACLPKEGGGLVYAVRLDNGGAAFNTDESNDSGCNNADGLCSEDRVFVGTDELPPGIPSDPVPVPPNKVLTGTKFKPIGASNTGRTFWYQIEDPNKAN